MSELATTHDSESVPLYPTTPESPLDPKVLTLIGDMLVYTRAQRQLVRPEAAQILGLPQSTLKALEFGKVPEDIELLSKIASFLEVSLKTLNDISLQAFDRRRFLLATLGQELIPGPPITTKPTPDAPLSLHQQFYFRQNQEPFSGTNSLTFHVDSARLQVNNLNLDTLVLESVAPRARPIQPFFAVVEFAKAPYQALNIARTGQPLPLLLTTRNT